jgi:hypothetical protein
VHDVVVCIRKYSVMFYYIHTLLVVLWFDIGILQLYLFEVCNCFFHQNSSYSTSSQELNVYGCGNKHRPEYWRA